MDFAGNTLVEELCAVARALSRSGLAFVESLESYPRNRWPCVIRVDSLLENYKNRDFSWDYRIEQTTSLSVLTSNVGTIFS